MFDLDCRQILPARSRQPETDSKIPAKGRKENPHFGQYSGVACDPGLTRNEAAVAFPEILREGQRMKNRLPRIRLVALRTASAAPLVGS